MYEVSITSKGLKGTSQYIANFRKRFPQKTKDIMNDLSSRVLQSARARVGSQGSGTGTLSNNLEAKWINQYSIKVSAPALLSTGYGTGTPRPYPYYQEMGFKPHYVHRSQWMGSTWTSNDEFAYVRKHTPYMRPAFNTVSSPDNVDKIIRKHLKPLLTTKYRG